MNLVFERLKNLALPKKLLLSAIAVCILVLAGVLIYSNSRYSDRYLEKVKDEIHDIFDAVNCGGGLAVNYQDRVVRVQLDINNTCNDELIERLEKKYGKAVSISEGYFSDLIPDE